MNQGSGSMFCGGQTTVSGLWNILNSEVSPTPATCSLSSLASSLAFAFFTLSHWQRSQPHPCKSHHLEWPSCGRHCARLMNCLWSLLMQASAAKERLTWEQNPRLLVLWPLSFLCTMPLPWFPLGSLASDWGVFSCWQEQLLCLLTEKALCFFPPKKL